jgi:tetratricopeptide (TPR) repeat protein
VGELETGEAQARAALEELAESPSVLDKVRTLNLLARIERLKNAPQQALIHLLQAGDELGESRSMEQAWRLRELGLAYNDMGECDRAEEMLRRAMTIYREAGSPQAIATTAGYLGDVLKKVGRDDEAFEVYRVGLAEVEDLAI